MKGWWLELLSRVVERWSASAGRRSIGRRGARRCISVAVRGRVDASSKHLFLSATLGFVGLETSLDFLWSLFGRSLAFALTVACVAARGRVAGLEVVLTLHLLKSYGNTLNVSLHDVGRDAFDAEDLDVNTATAFDRVFDFGELKLVDLAHVDGEAADCLQATVAGIALEVTGFLVRAEDLDIVKVTFTVVAPRAVENLCESRSTTISSTALYARRAMYIPRAFLAHDCGACCVCCVVWGVVVVNVSLQRAFLIK
jgi:hypothetical protein